MNIFGPRKRNKRREKNIFDDKTDSRVQFNVVIDEGIKSAVQEMAKGGFGALRITTEFVDEEDIENDDQRVLFEPIYSAYASVVFDANAKKYDKSDARHVTYLEQMTQDAADEEWGPNTSSAFAPPDQQRFNWNNGTTVWIASFYEIKTEKTDVILFKDPLGRKKTFLRISCQRFSA